MADLGGISRKSMKCHKISAFRQIRALWIHDISRIFREFSLRFHDIHDRFVNEISAKIHGHNNFATDSSLFQYTRVDMQSVLEPCKIISKCACKFPGCLAGRTQLSRYGRPESTRGTFCTKKWNPPDSNCYERIFVTIHKISRLKKKYGLKYYFSFSR